MSQIENLEASIAKQTQELADLKLALKEAKEQSPDKALADTLHGMLCNYNHTDGCGWFYEYKDKQPQWHGHAHGEYLKKAQKFICICKDLDINPDNAIDLFRLVKSI
jgi:hypothetical protein